MQLAKDTCACGHTIENHDGGRGAPCNFCGCAAAGAPRAFQVGMIHAMHELTVSMARLTKEIQAARGAGGTQAGI